MSIMIIDNYDSFTYNLYQMVQELVTEPVEVHRNDSIDLNGIVSRRPTGIILSPGPGHPGHDADFGVCKSVIQEQAMLDCPVLGVCLGHQGIVHHLGGTVKGAPEIVHGKTSKIRTTASSPIFEGLSDCFEAMRYHSLVACDDDFPVELEVTARESVHGLIMALQHRSRPLYGVQFHPESIGTPEGNKILRNFIGQC